ncbi:MAG: hypothetical protein ACC656_14130, partial [Candidatus Heimdallarchaeota archaeon]
FVLAMGMYTTSKIDGMVIIDGNFSIFTQESSRLFLNIISLTLILPLIVLQRLFYFYHSKHWNGFAIRRKLFRSRKLPYLVNVILVTALIYIGSDRGLFDIIPSLFIALWMIHSIKYYLLPQFGDLGGQTRRLDSMLTNADQYSRIPSHPRSTTTRPSLNPQINQTRTGSIPAVSRSGQRIVSTNYQNARQISSTSKKQKRKRQSKNQKNSRSTINIDPGDELKTLSPGAKINGNIANLLPTGRVDKKDLSCMFCYEEIKNSDNSVILCPHCKFPAHADEYTSWIQVSNLCARCSKSIAKSELTKPKYIVSAKEYVNKVLNKL